MNDKATLSAEKGFNRDVELTGVEDVEVEFIDARHGDLAHPEILVLRDTRTDEDVRFFLSEAYVLRDWLNKVLP